MSGASAHPTTHAECVAYDVADAGNTCGPWCRSYADAIHASHRLDGIRVPPTPQRGLERTTARHRANIRSHTQRGRIFRGRERKAGLLLREMGSCTRPCRTHPPGGRGGGSTRDLLLPGATSVCTWYASLCRGRWRRHTRCGVGLRYARAEALSIPPLTCENAARFTYPLLSAPCATA